MLGVGGRAPSHVPLVRGGTTGCCWAARLVGGVVWFGFGGRRGDAFGWWVVGWVGPASPLPLSLQPTLA